MWHLLVDLYQVCSYDLLGSGLVLPWGHKLDHRNKERKFQNSSSLKVEDLEFDILYVASLIGPLPSLFI